jgi:dienelactone hydrolase
VIIHEAFGLDDVQRRHADRLAGFGYLTLAVGLFSAGGTLRCLVSTMRALGRGQVLLCRHQCGALVAGRFSGLHEPARRHRVLHRRRLRAADGVRV